MMQQELHSLQNCPSGDQMNIIQHQDDGIRPDGNLIEQARQDFVRCLRLWRLEHTA
jgi:hypothetical protein